MSLDDLHASLASNGRPAAGAVGMGRDVEPLVSLVTSEGEEAAADDAELLARLESADTMAGGVEARLDELLGTLDDLLTRLEPPDTGLSQETMVQPSELPARPPKES